MAGALAGEAVEAHQRRPAGVTVSVASSLAVLARRLDQGDASAGEHGQDGYEARRGEATSPGALTVTLRVHQPNAGLPDIPRLGSQQGRSAPLAAGEGEGQEGENDRQSDYAERDEDHDALEAAHGNQEYAMIPW